MPQLGVSGSNCEKLLSYLNSTLEDLSNCKISYKSKNASILEHKCFIWVFSGKNLKIILSFLKSVSSNFSNWKVLCKNKNS